MPPFSGHGASIVVNVASSDATRSSRRLGVAASGLRLFGGPSLYVGLAPRAQISAGEW